MTFQLEIKEEAALEILNSYLYYQERRAGLGDEFLSHLEFYFERIISSPEHFPQKRKPYREAFLGRFPFLIIYEIFEDKIIVYSIFHTSQDPERKKK